MYQVIKPQEGYQTKFLSSSADIVIGGGAAGVGKTHALLLEPLRYSHVPNFDGVIFRRTTPQISLPGGLWDSSYQIYTNLKDKPRGVEGRHRWHFPSGSKIKFSHLLYDKNRFDYQGSSIPFIGFDELTHFSKAQFTYLISRNRSTSGVKPYIRATTNPQPQGWVKDMIKHYLYPDDYHIEALQGYPIPEMNGRVLFFTEDGGNIVWGNTKQEVMDRCPHIFKDLKMLKSLLKAKIMPENLVKSFTFISGDIYQNQKLLSADPGYLGNLLAMSKEDKDRLYGGCWKMNDGADILFEFLSLKDAFTNDFIIPSTSLRDRYLTADIALEGSDRFIIGVWQGLVLVDVIEIPKSDGKAVITKLENVAKRWKVPQSNIIFDYDGVGNFVKGFLKNATPFKNTPRTINKENYRNLSAQCFYKLAEMINGYEIFIEDRTYMNDIIRELHAVTKIPSDGKSKLDVIPKSLVKSRLDGLSPDFADMMKMRMLPLLTEKRKPKTSSH